MPTKIYWIHTFDNSAKMGIMPRPRGGDWLKDEITHLKNNAVTVLVSLLEEDEIDELQLNDESTFCNKEGITFIHFPIADRNVPASKEDTDELINHLVSKLNTGESTVIHCRMGIGRSSIIAAAVLLKYGLKARDIIENITLIRGLKVPDTEEQMLWLQSRE